MEAEEVLRLVELVAGDETAGKIRRLIETGVTADQFGRLAEILGEAGGRACKCGRSALEAAAERMAAAVGKNTERD